MLHVQVLGKLLCCQPLLHRPLTTKVCYDHSVLALQPSPSRDFVVIAHACTHDCIFGRWFCGLLSSALIWSSCWKRAAQPGLWRRHDPWCQMRMSQRGTVMGTFIRIYMLFDFPQQVASLLAFPTSNNMHT